MKLIIAEKPELGRDIANALLGTKEEKNGCISNDEYTITWAYGHLLELVEPDIYDERLKHWSEKELPIFFKNWKKAPAKDIVNKEGKIILNNKYKRDRLNLIGDLLKKADMVIHAGDPDEEGQNLIDEIIEYFNYTKLVKRVFVNDNIEKNILKAFQNIIDNKSQKSISDSAYARQMADKSFGINHTRLAGLRLNKKGLSIGRVQTAVLGLVVQRDEAILHHIKEKYYELTLCSSLNNNDNEYKDIEFKFKPNLDILDGNKRIMNKDVLNNIKASLKDFYKANTEIDKKDTFAPLPYNQTLLSAEMNRLYGYSLKKTLDITQILRDKYKAITYNRSDSQYLKLEHFKEAPNVTKVVMENLGCDFPLILDEMNSCFNDELAPNHHGIIPQEKIVDLSIFSEEERNVYKAIAERYLMQFLPPVKTKISTTSFNILEGSFVYKSSMLLDSGWKQYFNVKDQDNEDLIDGKTFVVQGLYDVNNIDSTIYEKETKPLVKYTEGTLVKDMTSVSKYVKDSILKKALKDKDKGKKGENGSIGTVATRGAIIDTLFKRGFLANEGKHIVSTDLGKEFYHLIPEDIKTAEVTAKWWLIQENIKANKLNVNDLMLEGVDEFRKIKERAYHNAVLKSNDEVFVGECPICKGNVIERQTKKGKIWLCEASKDGCSFKMFENTSHFKNPIKLSTSKVKKLLDGGKIEAKLTNKTGEKYVANLKLKINGSYVNFEAVPSKNQK